MKKEVEAESHVRNGVFFVNPQKAQIIDPPPHPEN
jgi:hypothetical protein